MKAIETKPEPEQQEQAQDVSFEDLSPMSLEDIFSTDTTEYANVEVPALARNGRPGIVRIRSLSAGEMIEFMEANEDPKKKKVAGIRLIIKSVVDGQGRNTGREEHEALWKRQSTAVTSVIIDEIMKLNKMGKYSETAKNA